MIFFCGAVGRRRWKCTRPRQIGVPALATHGGLFYPAVFSRKDTPFRLPLFSSPKIVQRGFFTLGVPRAKRGESNTLFIVPGRFLHGTEALIHMSLICMTECKNRALSKSFSNALSSTCFGSTTMMDPHPRPLPLPMLPIGPSPTSLLTTEDDEPTTASTSPLFVVIQAGRLNWIHVLSLYPCQ